MAATGSKLPCFYPLHGYQKLGGGIVFSKAGSNGSPMAVPCGKCIGCRLMHGDQWTARLTHECRFHRDSSFITLTYSQESLPTGGTLVKSHVSSFIKRLRARIAPQKIRFFACGEYGSENLRPHYHLICFGWRPADAVLINPGANNRRYESAVLSSVWGQGFAEFGEVVPATCSYVASYVLKKITGPPAKAHYERFHPSTGEIYEVIPEFAVMSRNPGIGRLHYDRYSSGMYPDDFTVIGGRKTRVPRYYDRLYKADDPLRFEKVQLKRQEMARKNKKDATPERLKSREIITKARINNRKSSL